MNEVVIILGFGGGVVHTMSNTNATYILLVH